MNKRTISLAIALVLALGGLTLTRAAPGNAPPAQTGGAPTVVSYQGRVQVSGAPFTGTGYFKFAVVNRAGNITYWSNDGTSSGGSEPTNAVTLTVNNGLFTVLLGDTMSGMQPLSAAVFSAPDRYLRVWFRAGGSGAFTRLEPDTRIAAVPYALQAQHVAPPGNVIIVAKSNGDFTSIGLALDSITDASAGNPYLIWVAPGWYSEAITLKPYVHLQGAGQGVTFIQAAPSFDDGRTLELAHDTTVRDLSISNIGTGATNYGMYGDVVTNVQVSNVYVEAVGSGTSNIAIYLTGNSKVVLENVTAFAGKAGNTNIGLRVTASPAGGPEVTLHGGSFTGAGGTNAYGIRVYGGLGTFVGAADVRATGADATNTNAGLESETSPTVLLQGGFFLGSGGRFAYGLRNLDGAHLEAEGVTAKGESGASFATAAAFYNYENGRAILRGGSFTANAGGGMDGWAIHNFSTAAVSNNLLEAYDVTALAFGGTSNNLGLRNEGFAVARVYGGTFTARGGGLAAGLLSNSNLTVQGAFGIGENGTTSNYGLYVLSGGTVRADSCRFKGSTYAVRETGGTLYLAVSQLDGGMRRTGGTCTCFQVYDGNYAAYACP